jgi:hypothetical protein
VKFLISKVLSISKYPLIFVFVGIFSYEVTLRLVGEKPLLSDLWSAGILISVLVASTIFLVAVVVWINDSPSPQEKK